MTNSRAGGTSQTVVAPTSTFTTSSTTYVIVTAMTLTLPNNSGRFALVLVQCTNQNDTAGQNVITCFHDDGSPLPTDMLTVQSILGFASAHAFLRIVPQDGSAIAMYMKVSANNGSFAVGANVQEPYIQSLEL